MNTADMLIHAHPELDTSARAELKRRIEEAGVDCADFVHRLHPHTLIVKYDPEAIQGMRILDTVREVDPKATRVGL